MNFNKDVMTPASCEATEKALGRKIIPGEPFVCIIEELAFKVREKEKALVNCRTVIKYSRKGRAKRNAAIQELEKANERLATLNIRKDLAIDAQLNDMDALRKWNWKLKEEIQGRSIQNDTIIQLQESNQNLSKLIVDKDSELTAELECNKQQYRTITEQDEKLSKFATTVEIMNKEIIKLREKISWAARVLRSGGM